MAEPLHVMKRGNGVVGIIEIWEYLKCCSKEVSNKDVVFM